MLSRIKNYLSLSKKEWNGMVVLIILIAIILAVPYVLRSFSKDTPIDSKQLDKALAILDQAKKNRNNTSGKAEPGEIIELNTADSAKLTKLNGIGPSFAKRIISYRERLGGFYKKEQLKEVFGLDSEKYAGMQTLVSADPSHIRKIAINSVTFDRLRRFPYLTYKQVNAIIRFREQHGEYEYLSDLKNIAIMDDSTLVKIKPYIAFK